MGNSPAPTTLSVCLPPRRGQLPEVADRYVGRRDLALLIDRLQILFGRPAMITEGRGLAATITSDSLPIDLLRGIIEATRGLASTHGPEASPLARLHRQPEG